MLLHAQAWNPPPGCHRVGYHEAFSCTQQALLASKQEDLLPDETKLIFENTSSSVAGGLVQAGTTSTSTSSGEGLFYSVTELEKAITAQPASIMDVEAPKAPAAPGPAPKRRRGRGATGSAETTQTALASSSLGCVELSDDDTKDFVDPGGPAAVGGRGGRGTGRGSNGRSRGCTSAAGTAKAQAKSSTKTVKGSSRDKDRAAAEEALEEATAPVQPVEDKLTTPKDSHVKQSLDKLDKARVRLAKVKSAKPDEAMDPTDLDLIDKLAECHANVVLLKGVVALCAATPTSRSRKAKGSGTSPEEMRRMLVAGQAAGIMVPCDALDKAYDEHCRQALHICLDAWQQELHPPTERWDNLFETLRPVVALDARGSCLSCRANGGSVTASCRKLGWGCGWCGASCRGSDGTGVTLADLAVNHEAATVIEFQELRLCGVAPRVLWHVCGRCVCCVWCVRVCCVSRMVAAHTHDA